MSLSICMFARAPAARVATLLAPVRALADEIVIAADARVDAAGLTGYAGIADRLFRVEFHQLERHLPWLYAQCSCDWILRLDDDEVVSGALADRLPGLLTSRDVQQYRLRRAWLYPDAGRILDELPWSVDFEPRLVRNDGTLRLAQPVEPCEYVEAPLYHLELLESDHAARRDKAVRHEATTPLRIAPGGGRLHEALYLPELRASPRTRALPEEDRARVQNAIDAAGDTEPGPAADVPLVSLAEMDWHREGRAVAPTAYRAAIEPVDPAPVLSPGEHRVILFRVTNQGTELWPRGLDADPPIRMAYRWEWPDGSMHTPDGLRTAFTRVVRPGERILVPLAVLAPREPGRYVLQVDVVHELVAWFEQPSRVEVEVRAAAAPPPAGLRLQETPPPRRLRRLRNPIPRRLHRVWLGGSEMPAPHAEFGRSVARHHPAWEMRLWTDADLDELDITPVERQRSRSPAELSNVVRFEILARHGGVYVDTDVEAIQPLDRLLSGVDAFAALELPGRAGTAILGSAPGHPAFVRAARLARETLGLGQHSADANGPYFLSLLLEQEPGVAIFGAHRFYPYHWDEPEKAGDTFPGAYAVHHWSTSWFEQEGVR